jgi:hypothetical protein
MDAQARDLWTTMRTVAISATYGGAGDSTIHTPASDRIFLVPTLVLASSAAVTLTFKSGSTAISGAMPFAAGTRVDWIYNGCPFLKGRAKGDALVITAGGATTVTGYLVVLEPVY